MVSHVCGTVPLRRGVERMLVFSIEVWCTESGCHDTFGIRKLKKARRGLFRVLTMASKIQKTMLPKTRV